MPRLPDSFRRALDSAGDPAPGALLYVYRAGTTSAVTTYSDSALTTANASPVVADASGAFGDVYLQGGFYKAKITTAAGVDLPGSPVDDVEVADDVISVSTLAVAALTAIYPTRQVTVRGGTTDGDEAGGAYVYRASEPTRSAKFQDVGGYWFEKAVSAPATPQDFGAVADGTTDDSTAINEWAQYLRDNNVAGKIPGGDYFCGTTTLYLGGITFEGAGSALNNRWPTVQTNFLSNANPIVSMANDADTARTFQGVDWSKFSASAAGGTVATIETWFDAAYTGQIGIWLGRSHNFVQATTDVAAVPDPTDNEPGPEVTVTGGIGSMRMRDWTVQDVGGIGVYVYKMWGDSLVCDGLIRCCGGIAAKAANSGAGDDTYGGGVFVDSLTVDTVFERIHCFGTGNGLGVHADATLDHWGTAFQVGRDKITTDALNRVYDSTNNIHFNHCHTEGYNEGFKAFNGKWCTLKDFNSNGSGGLYGGVTIGHASNPTTDCRWQVERLRVASAKYIRACQGYQVSLGEIVNATPSTVTDIQYWGPTTFEVLGMGAGGMTLAEAGFTISPQETILDAPGGATLTDKTVYSPYARSGALPASPFDNLLPPFNGGSGTALSGWVGTGTGTETVDANGSTVSLVGSTTSDGRTITYTITGVTEGEIYTFQVLEQFAAEIGAANATVRMLDASDVQFFGRSIGSGLKPAGLYRERFNFTAPAGGTIKVELGMFSTVAGEFIAPTLNRGLAADLGDTLPTTWMAADGLYLTA